MVLDLSSKKIPINPLPYYLILLLKKMGILHLSVYTSGSGSLSGSGSNCSDFDFDPDSDPDSKSVNYFPSKMKDAWYFMRLYSMFKFSQLTNVSIV